MNVLPLQPAPKSTLDQVPVGTCFQTKGGTYMKVFRSHNVNINVVNLETGRVITFIDSLQVHLFPDATLTLNP